MSDLAVYRMSGAWVNVFTLDTFLETIETSRSMPGLTIIGNHNMHSIYLYHCDAKMAAFFDSLAHFVFIDGMPIIWWGRVLGYPLGRSNRLTVADWFLPFMARAAERGWREFYLGNRPGVAESGAQKLRETYPEMMIKTRHGYFETEGDSHSSPVDGPGRTGVDGAPVG